MTLDKNCAGRVLTTPQNHIYSQISYYTLADLLYNILKIDEQATKYKITHTETIICILTGVCLCMCVYLCIYAYIYSMLVSMHIHNKDTIHKKSNNT